MFIKKYIYLATSLCLIFSMSLIKPAYGSTIKWFKIGKFQDKVVDSGDQGESSGEGTFAYYYFDNFVYPYYDSRAWHLGTKDWTDENGNPVQYKISGAGHGSADEVRNTMPLPDAEGITIRKYLRHQPPTITVDGNRLDEPFPFPGDEVNPNVIPGTAEQMVESVIRTSMGITIRQRILGWSQSHHDDYIIYDWTFKNTGNIDLDPEIELPNQTLTDVYFLRGVFASPGGEAWEPHWTGAYGQYPEDSIRIVYSYQSWGEVDIDDFGKPDPETKFLRRPMWVGETILHADQSTTVHTDNPSQPQMTGSESMEVPWIKKESGSTGLDDHALLYETMQHGFHSYNGVDYLQGTYPGTYHTVMAEDQGFQYPYWDDEMPVYSIGPFTMAPQDSFRIVWAAVVGSISPEKAWEIGKAWSDENCTWDGPNILPPPAQNFPELAPTENDYAKDCWVSTGLDSLFKNAAAAKLAIQQDYNIPVPPPAPSIEVSSKPDMIVIEWGTKSEEAADFAGYKIYRAKGLNYYSEEEGVVNGEWKMIKEFEGSSTHYYEDKDVDRSVAYYYYVSAFDDGSDNINGVKPGESLESGKYLNMTTRAAYLTRPAKELSTVRVVPNPYNINAHELQYPGESDKIMFLNLPPICTINIFTESADLVKTINHTNGAGDEAWQFSTSTTGQIVVSGIYFARIETPSGDSRNVKFLIIR